MKPFKAFGRSLSLMILVLMVPVFAVLVARPLPLRAVAVARSKRTASAKLGADRPAHPPRTVWERMQDPRGWWRSRLEKANRAAETRLRPSISGARSMLAAPITNPIFSVPPAYGTGGSGGRILPSVISTATVSPTYWFRTSA